MRRLLVAYGEGLDTDHALAKALDTSLAEMQAGFDRALDDEFGALKKAFAGVNPEQLQGVPLPVLRAQAAEHPGNYPVQMTLGHELRRCGRDR